MTDVAATPDAPADKKTSLRTRRREISERFTETYQGPVMEMDVELGSHDLARLFEDIYHVTAKSIMEVIFNAPTAFDSDDLVKVRNELETIIANGIKEFEKQAKKLQTSVAASNLSEKVRFNKKAQIKAIVPHPICVNVITMFEAADANVGRLACLWFSKVMSESDYRDEISKIRGNCLTTMAAITQIRNRVFNRKNGKPSSAEKAGIEAIPAQPPLLVA